MNRQIQLRNNSFQQANTLIFRGKPSHSIINLTQPQKNIELKIIIVSKQGSFKTKKGEITQFLVADQSACCYMNVFNQTGRLLSEGDIIYINGAYTSYYKQSLLIYQGSCSIIRRIGRWYSKFNLSNNISLSKNLQQGQNLMQSQNK